jgi:DNA-binding XRE family transcriptional regulator
MTPQEFNNVRKTLGKSQRDLAKLIGTSLRSVQAYEQGWREVPPQIERMALFFLYQKLKGQDLVPPCWEMKDCSKKWRENCPAWEFQAQGPCWFLNGDFCVGKSCGSWGEKMKICSACEVFKCVMENAAPLEEDKSKP